MRQIQQKHEIERLSSRSEPGFHDRVATKPKPKPKLTPSDSSLPAAAKSS
jgi:hypothetical protein